LRLERLGLGLGLEEGIEGKDREDWTIEGWVDWDGEETGKRTLWGESEL